MTKNTNRVSYSKKFQKQLEKAPVEIKEAFLKRRKIFLKEPFHTMLNNYMLIGNYLGSRSINITGDWRAIYSESADKNSETMIVFEFLGTHSELYK